MRNYSEQPGIIPVWTGHKIGTKLDWTRVNSQLFRPKDQTGTITVRYPYDIEYSVRGLSCVFINQIFLDL